jgi:prephenate dehydrogenase
LTDVGSTKVRLTRDIEKIIPDGVNFIGGHPMAGSEKRGVIQARGDLFKDSLCILTRTKKTDPGALKTIEELWQTVGAKVVILSLNLHDRIVSQISHLPHMLVFSMLAGIDIGSLRFASSGFYDTTRIASSDSKIWRDIAISNKDEIAKSISEFKKNLSVLEKAIRLEDSSTLLKVFKNAKKKRELLG